MNYSSIAAIDTPIGTPQPPPLPILSFLHLRLSLWQTLVAYFVV